jgi:hypothetical protein
MKLGPASRYPVGQGLIAASDCEECRRVYCECGVGVAARGRSNETFEASGTK